MTDKLKREGKDPYQISAEVSAATSQIEYLFDKYFFSIFGGRESHVFHYDAKLTSYKICNYLHEKKVLPEKDVNSARKNIGKSIKNLFYLFSDFWDRKDQGPWLPKDHPKNFGSSSDYTPETLLDEIEYYLFGDDKNQPPLYQIARETEGVEIPSEIERQGIFEKVKEILAPLEQRVADYSRWYAEVTDVVEGPESLYNGQRLTEEERRVYWKITEKEKKRYGELTEEEFDFYERLHSIYHEDVIVKFKLNGRRDWPTFKEVKEIINDWIYEEGNSLPSCLQTEVGAHGFEKYYKYKRYLVKKYMKRQEYENTDMFMKLIFSNDILHHLGSVTDFFRITFGEGIYPRYREYLSGEQEMVLSTLLKAQFRVGKWTETDFEWFFNKRSQKPTWKSTPEGFEIAHAQMLLTRQIDSIIENTDPTRKIYIAKGFEIHGKPHTREDLMPVYHLIRDLYNYELEMAYIEQQPSHIKDFNLKGGIGIINNRFGIGMSLTDKLREGGPSRFFHTSTIEKIAKVLQDFSFKLLEENEVSYPFWGRKQIFDATLSILDRVYEFAAQQGHQLFLSEEAPDYNWYATKIWHHENTKGYHVVFKLCEFLGFDPLFFDELTPEIFKNGKYQRHHFRDTFLRKKSYHMRDVILTDVWNHGTYEVYLGHEKFMEAVLDTMKELISMKDDVDRDDARHILTKNMMIYYLDSDRKAEIREWVTHGFKREGEYDASQPMLGRFQGMNEQELDREVIKALVDNVLSKWKWSNEEEFNQKLKLFNKRRRNYARTGNYKGLLLDYDMGKGNQRFLEGAAILHANLGRSTPLSATGVEIPKDKIWDKYISRESYAFIGELIKEGLLPQIRLMTLFADYISPTISNMPPSWGQSDITSF